MDATLPPPAPASVQASPKKNKAHTSPKNKVKESPRHTLYFHNTNRDINTNRDHNIGSATETKRPVLVARRRLSNTPDSTETPSVDSQSSQKSEPQPSSTRNARPNHVYESRVAETFKAFQRAKAQDNWRAPRNGHKGPGSRPGRRDRHKDFDDTVDLDANRKVLVSGFPAYTQSQDLARVLSELGPSQILRCKNRLAVVLFENEQLAQNALDYTEDLYIYGEFIQIYPYTSARHVDELFRSYKKVITKKQGLDIIEPSKIDLSGEFGQQFENIQAAVRLTRAEVQDITRLYEDLEAVLCAVWPGCRAIPFGSIPMGLGIKSSDADCFVSGVSASRGGAAAFVSRARRLLSQHPRTFSHLVSIPRANTPIVKFLHIPTNRHCDVSAKTPLGAQNSRLLKVLLDTDPRLAPLAVCLKYWARVHSLSGTGRLTNYALALLVVFYLQRLSLAPAVESLQRDKSASFLVDHWDAGFHPPDRNDGSDDGSMAELLGGFFEFYANFDFENLVVCPLIGEPIPKAAFEKPETLPAAFHRYVGNVAGNLTSPLRHGTAFCVQDPFELSHNVASAVSARLAQDIQAHIRYAAEAYKRDRDAGSPEFLRTILLTQPRLERRQRTAPTTRIFLIPRVRGDFAEADWRPRVREILLQRIFATMLQLPLQPDSEAEPLAKDERAAGMDTERYRGRATAPVWRRRPERRGAGAALVEKHEGISRQILENGGCAPLVFRLELGFKDAPRSCYALLKLDEGDLDVFRGFVRFFHSEMFEWFRTLLRPHLRAEVTPEEERPEEVAERRAAPITFEPARDVTRLIAAVSLAPDT